MYRIYSNNITYNDLYTNIFCYHIVGLIQIMDTVLCSGLYWKFTKEFELLRCRLGGFVKKLLVNL